MEIVDSANWLTLCSVAVLAIIELLWIKKDMKIITKVESTIGSSNLVKNGSSYIISDLYNNAKEYLDSNHIYTDENEIKTRIRSTNTELKKVIKKLLSGNS